MKAAIITLFLILTITGCSVVTPPTRSKHVESPKVLKEGETKLDVELGGSAILFAPGNGYVTTAISKGLGDYSQIGGDFTVATFFDGGVDSIETYVTANFEYKTTTKSLQKYLAFQAGGGFGYSTYGYVASVNTGIILGYENKTAVPFLNLFYNFNLPFQTKKGLYVSDGFMSGDEKEMIFDPTHGLEANLGVKFPKLHFGLSIGARYYVTYNGDEGGAGVAASLNFESTF